MIGKGYDCLIPGFVPIDSDRKKFLRVPCGRCFNCRKKHAREWSFRLACEQHDWKHSCFVTLTYADEFLPTAYVDSGIISDSPTEIPSLCKRDVQLFIKRLRKHLGFKIRYFCAGEYGSRTMRPHYHLIIFGIDESFKHLINDCWKKGFVQVGDVRPGSIQYVAGYCEKKLFYDDKNPFVVRECLNCSQHLGERYFFENYIDKISDTNLSVRWGEYNYPIPRTFKKRLIAEGKIKPQTQEDIYNLQQIQLYELSQDLKHKDTDIKDFFRQRIANAVSSHFSRVNARDKI